MKRRMKLKNLIVSERFLTNCEWMHVYVTSHTVGVIGAESTLERELVQE